MLCVDDERGDVLAVTMRRCGIGAAVVLLALQSFGCQSTRSWSQGCPGIYSGVKFYREQMAVLPTDGKVFFSLDLPFTLIVDTLALPVTAFTRPKRQPGGYPVGCKWAQKENWARERDKR